jgi:vancomycin permeability regulator SanA
VLLLVVLIAVIAVIGAPRLASWTVARGHVVPRASDVPVLQDGEHRAAVVLGAGLVGERPSRLLRERIDAAIELLEQDRVDLIVMSGDNSTEYYDEPTVMRRYALEHGAPAHQVAPDYAGRRTWDSCVRARDVFGLDEAVIVTNAFHVDRATVSCRAAGLDATGLSVDDSGHSLGNRIAWRARELAATGRGLLDAWVLKPEPAVGGDPIDPWDPCALYASLAPSVASESADDFAQFDC